MVDGRYVVATQLSSGNRFRYEDFRGTDVRGDSVPVRVAASGDTVRISLSASSGFPITVDTAIDSETALMPSEDGGAGGLPASAVLASDGRVAAVGEPGANRHAGQVEVYVRAADGGWAAAQQLTPDDESGPALFGASLAVSDDGNTIAAGAPGDHEGYTPHAVEAGAVWAFRRSGGRWVQLGRKTSGYTLNTLGFGQSVAISGDGVTVVAAGSRAWAFPAAPSPATGPEELVPPSDDPVGATYSVALSQDASTAVVGSPVSNNQAGAAWVFRRIGDAWSLASNTIRGSASPGSQFARAIDVSSTGQTVLLAGVGGVWTIRKRLDRWAAVGNVIQAPADDDSAASFGAFPEGLAISADGTEAVLGGHEDGQPVAWTATGASGRWRVADAPIRVETPLDSIGGVDLAHDEDQSARVLINGNVVDTPAVQP